MKLLTAAFADEYAGIFVRGLKEFIDEMLIITPDLFLTISVAKTIDGISVPLKLRSKTFSNSSIRSPKNVSSGLSLSLPSIFSTFVVAAGEFPPAPLTRMSMVPNCSCIIFIALWREALSRTFAETPIDDVGGCGWLCCGADFRRADDEGHGGHGYLPPTQFIRRRLRAREE